MRERGGSGAAKVRLAARKAAAEARVDAALGCLHEAQAAVDRAGQALCSVEGMSAEWRRLGALFDQVKRRYYAVAGRSDSLSLANRLLLDREPDERELRWAREGGRS